MRVLWDALQEEKKVLDVSGDEPQLRQQWNRDIRARIPGHKLRRGAPKMQLRPDEENELALVWPAALQTCGIADAHLMCCTLYAAPPCIGPAVLAFAWASTASRPSQDSGSADHWAACVDCIMEQRATDEHKPAP